MKIQTCPSCSWLVRVPDRGTDRVAACPVCCQCLAVPSPWPAGAVGDSAVRPLLSGPGAEPGPPRVPRELLTTFACPGAPLRVVHLLILFHSAFLTTLCAAILVVQLSGAPDVLPPLSGFEIAFLCVLAPLVGAYGIWYGARRSVRARLWSPPAALPAAAAEMGAPLALYSNHGARLTPLLLALIFLGAGLPLLTKGLGSGPLPGYLIKAVLFGGGAYCLNRHRYRPPLYRVVLFAKGFVVCRGGGADPWPWDRVAAVRLEMPQTATNIQRLGATWPHVPLVLTRDDGAAFTHGAGDSFAAHAQHAVCARLVPRLREALRRGEVISFGPLRLLEEGIARGRDFVPWDGVAGVRVRRGNLVVWKSGCWRAAWAEPLSAVPNAAVLLNLLPAGTTRATEGASA